MDSPVSIRPTASKSPKFRFSAEDERRRGTTRGMVRKERSANLMVVVAALAGLLAGCRKTPAVRGAPPPPQVSVVSVQLETVPESYEFPGEVEPYRRVEVRARVDGIIEDRPYTEGALVRQGQLLYRLDRVRYDAAYRSAQARFENAKLTYDRLQPLLAQNAVAQQDVDNARFELESARATLDAAKKDLDDTEIRAGIDGRVGRTRLDIGARVTGSSDLLTTIDQLDPIYVTFEPSSDQLLNWRADSTSRALITPGSRLGVQLVLSDGSIYPRAGKLDFVAPTLDAATGTQEFRAIFDNSDHVLVPGQAVRARLLGFGRRNALAVPTRAVQSSLGRQFVFVVTPGDTVLARDVRPGSWSGARWIIREGLHPGDKVVVDGFQKVVAGRPVHPVVVSDSASVAGGSSPASARSETTR